MAIAATCDSCKTTFRVKDEHAGKRGTCPKCKSPVEIPTAAGGIVANPPKSGATGTQQALMQEILASFTG